MSGPNAKYAANYRKPPVHTRFKKGQSGNPHGRRAMHSAVTVTPETFSSGEYEALLRADFASFAQHCFH